MAHEIATQADGRAAIAYVGQTPWHGLGQVLQPGADIETWKEAAGLNWTLEEKPALWLDNTGDFEEVPGKKILVRSDTREALSVVSDRYNVVQPGEVLDFYQTLVKAGGFDLDVAGVLFNGRKYWALAKINETARIMGQDKIDGYLLLATSCDGSLATTAQFTSVRVVCNNTLRISVDAGADIGTRESIKIPHNRQFDAEAVKVELGLAHRSFQSFIDQAVEMGKRKVDNKEAIEFLVKVVGDVTKDIEEQEDAKTIKKIYDLFQGQGQGADLKSAKGTTWGLVNAVTEYFDHHRQTRTQDSRLNRAWFGDGAAAKDRAWAVASALVAA